MHSSARISNGEELIFKKLQVSLKMRKDHNGNNDCQKARIEVQIGELFDELDELYGEKVDRREWLIRMTDNGPDEALFEDPWAEVNKEARPQPQQAAPIPEPEPELIYTPSLRVLEQWRDDAQRGMGDNKGDQPRRLLVLVESLVALIALADERGFSDKLTQVKPSLDRPAGS